jgi:hypothetical protein
MVRKIKHKKGMEKKPLIIAAVALVAVVILAVLLFFGQPSVGRAYFISGDTFDKYQAGSEESLQFPLTAGKIIPVKVGANIASKESVAFSFQMEYSPEHFELINVVPGLDEIWGTNYLRTSTPSIGKSTSFNKILFEHATFDYEKAISGSVHLADVNFRVLQNIEDPENIAKLIQIESIDVLEMSEDPINLILSYVPVKGEMPTCVSEVCGNGVDDDCDGKVDEDCEPETVVCTDKDGDGYCVEKGDCDDNVLDDPSNCPTDPSIKPPCQVGPFKVCAYCKNPGVTDACDGYDNNCNGIIDDNIDADECEFKCTAEGYQWIAETQTCCGDDGTGDDNCYVTEEPLPDADADGIPDHEDSYPFCNDWMDDDNDQVPNDCDNCIFTPNPTQTDTDGDTLGDACDHEEPTCLDYDNDGYCQEDDCDDSNPEINPGVEDVCGDNLDNNCNFETDENCVTEVSVLHGDVDGDEEISIDDAILLARIVLGIDTESGYDPIVADVDCDGVVTIDDAISVAQSALGIYAGELSCN